MSLLKRYRAVNTLFYALYGEKYICQILASDITWHSKVYKRGDLLAVIRNKVLTISKG